jgi:hypothetical protein
MIVNDNMSEVYPETKVNYRALQSSYPALTGLTRRRCSVCGMTRIRIALAALALFGLSACGIAQSPTATDSIEVAADLPVEAQALTALGFDVTGAALVEAPTATPSAGPNRKVDGHRRARVLLRRNVLHGEAVVQTKDGQKTVAVQRGAVTAINNTSVTVKSTDGFTQTWTFGNPLHVVEHRTTVQPSALKVGDEIGVAGAKESSGYVARLIAKR